MQINTHIMLFMKVTRAQKELRAHILERRVSQGLTQKGFALRAGVSIHTLRRFEQQGSMPLKSFLKILMVLDTLEAVVDAVKPPENSYSSTDEVLESSPPKERKRGWRT